MQLRIRELMRERGMTSAMLAEKLGQSENAVNSVIMRNSASTNTLDAYAKALGVPTWELITPCGASAVLPAASNNMFVTCPDCGTKLKLNISVEFL